MNSSDGNIRITRRDLLLGCGTAMFTGWPRPEVAAAAATIARGHVFDDIAGDGVRRPRSKGIPGVLVSNGCDVVRTDADGAWQLPVGDGQSIFVIKPPHWSIASQRGIPAFFRHHQPLGTPAGAGVKFPGLAPTGALPGTIDFGLRHNPESAEFDALLMADMQPANAIELAYVAKDVATAVQSTSARFAINHGDVMGDDLSLFPRYREMIQATGLTWHHCPGNHDMNLDSPTAQYAFETWKREIGPTHYAFQHGGATFILLNNVDFYGRGKAPSGQRAYRGRIGEQQLRFVANVLAKIPREHLVIVSMHIPLVSFEDAANPADNTADRRRLLKILSRHPHTVSFSGHSHTTEHHYLGASDGFAGAEPHHHHVLTAVCGSWWSGPRDQQGIPVSDSRDGSPRGLHVLSVDGNSYETRFVATAKTHDRQMRIALGSPGCADTVALLRTGSNDAPSYVFIDVFDGGPRTKVTLEIEGFDGQSIEVKKVPIADPFIVQEFTRHAALCKPWVEPAVSSHMWAAALPCSLVPGTYRVRARAVDQYGREHTAHRVLEIAV